MASDRSPAGFITFEKEVHDGEHKLELTVYDELYIEKIKAHHIKYQKENGWDDIVIEYAGSPHFMLYNKEGIFGNIMDETRYGFIQHHDHSKFDTKNLDELFALAIQVEKELTLQAKPKILKRYLTPMEN